MCRYGPGSYVRVKPEDAAVRYRKPHLRVPGEHFLQRLHCCCMQLAVDCIEALNPSAIQNTLAHEG